MQVGDVRAGEFVTRTARAAQPRLPALVDQDISVTCPTCNAKQTLAQAKFDETPLHSTYSCMKGCEGALVDLTDVAGGQVAFAVHVPSGMFITVDPLRAN